MNLFTNLEIIIMVSVVGFLGLVIVVLSIMELISNKKNKELLSEKTIEMQIIDTLKEEVNNEEFEDELSLENIDITKPLSVIEENKKEEIKAPFKNENVLSVGLFEEEKEATYDNVKEKELETSMEKPVEEILIEDIDGPFVPHDSYNEPKASSIEFLEENPSSKASKELLKIEEELKNPLSLEDTINNLEAIEEENAIISYQELLEVTKELSVVNAEDAGDEPISLSEVFEQFNLANSNLKETPIGQLELDDNYQKEIETITPFTSTNGIETENLNEIQLENTANLEKLDKEIRKTNKFLHILNELKKNLD